MGSSLSIVRRRSIQLAAAMVRDPHARRPDVGAAARVGDRAQALDGKSPAQESIIQMMSAQVIV